MARSIQHVPDFVVHAARGAIMKSDGEGKAAAYQALATIRENTPVAYDASQMPGEVTKRLDLYMASVTHGGMDPTSAIQHVDKYFSVEGERLRAQRPKYVKAELKKINEADVISRMSSGWRSSTDGFEGVAESRRATALTDAYRMAYERHRDDNHEPEEAHRLAAQSLERSWGTTGLFGRNALVKNPVEKTYPAIDGKHDYVVEQAKNVARTELTQRGKMKADDLGFSTDPEVMLVSSKETDADMMSRDPRVRNAPRYDLYYRNPNGSVERYGSFRADVTGPRMAWEEKQRQKLRDSLKPTEGADVSISGIVAP
jgi:hypothetical protein